MGVAVDTNILVRRITNDDPVLSPKAVRLLDGAKPGSMLLDRLIIEELGYVLRLVYGFNKADITAVFSSLLDDEVFYIPDRENTELTVELFGSEKPLSFEDCWLLALKRSGKVSKVATFDTNLLKRL